MAGYAFLLLFVAGIVGGLTRWPLLVIGAYMMSYYGHPVSRWWGALLPDLRWSLTAAAAALIAAFLHKSAHSSPKPWFADRIVILMIAFAGWLWIQATWAFAYEDHIIGTTFITKYLLFVYVMIKLLDSMDALDFMCVAHIIGCAYLGVLAWQVGSGGDRLDGVGGPDLNDSNTMSMQMATAAMLGLVQVLSGPWWKRGIVILCMPFILNAMVLTQSRGSFLGLFVGGFAAFMLAPPGKKKIIGMLGAAGVVLFLAVASQSFWERMNTIKAEDGERDLSAESRIVVAYAQLQMFKDYPMGTGHRGTAELSPKYIDQKYMAANGNNQRSSHNTFLSVISEHGIPGIILYFSLLFVAFRRIFKLRGVTHNNDDPDLSRIAMMAAGLGGALVVIYTAGQFADYIRKEVIAWMFAMLVAVTRVYETKKATLTAPAPVEPKSFANTFASPSIQRIPGRT